MKGLGFGIGFSLGRPSQMAGTPAPTPTLTRHVRVLGVGTSTFAGVGCGDGTGTKPEITNAYVLSPPAKAAERLAARGIPAHINTIMSDGANGTGTSWTEWRPDITATPSATSSRSPTAGGVYYVTKSTAGNSIGFSPAAQVDTIEFLFSRYTGATGTMGVYIDGSGSPAYSQVAENGGAEVMHRGTVSFALGVHSFILRGTNSSNLHGPVAVNAYNSAIKSVAVFNAGARNWGTSEWIGAANAASPLEMIAAIGPDVVVISIGNDYRQTGTPPATYKSRLQAIINKAVGAGAKCVLAVPTPIQTYWTADGWSQAVLRQVYVDLVDENPTTCTLVDTPQVLKDAGLTAGPGASTWAELNAAGLTFDSLHCKAAVSAVSGTAYGNAVYAALVAMGLIA